MLVTLNVSSRPSSYNVPLAKPTQFIICLEPLDPLCIQMALDL
uniref:Uncharacterized protein n=1 Tax=Nelumbo nucifera TaxID=4432 RepID=A0A822Z1H4_NELNU|nr:TPA_asm: hypothetical protein HUJ06_005988 [Nelumbo nucifera]